MKLNRCYMEVDNMNTKTNNFITPEEYEKLQDTFDCKTEYNNGTIIMHSNTSMRHNEIIQMLSAELVHFFKDTKCSVYSESIEVVFDEYHKYKPDLFVMCDDSTRDGESFTSSPKIIFEVISKSTASHDRITKLQLYKKYRVPEYNMVEQDGTIFQCILKDDEYIVKEYNSTDQYISSVFPDLKINLKDIF